MEPSLNTFSPLQLLFFFLILVVLPGLFSLVLLPPSVRLLHVAKPNFFIKTQIICYFFCPSPKTFLQLTHIYEANGPTSAPEYILSSYFFHCTIIIFDFKNGSVNHSLIPSLEVDPWSWFDPWGWWSKLPLNILNDWLKYHLTPVLVTGTPCWYCGFSSRPPQ